MFADADQLSGVIVQRAIDDLAHEPSFLFAMRNPYFAAGQMCLACSRYLKIFSGVNNRQSVIH